MQNRLCWHPRMGLRGGGLRSKVSRVPNQHKTVFGPLLYYQQGMKALYQAQEAAKAPKGQQAPQTLKCHSQVLILRQRPL